MINITNTLGDDYIEMSEDFNQQPNEAIFPIKINLSISKLFKKHWKQSLLFTLISTIEIGLMGYGLVNMETLYKDYDEDNNPLTSFSLNILIPFIGAKILRSVKTALITRNATT